MTTLEDKVNSMLVNDAELEKYFATRDNEEHIHIKKPSTYIDEVKKYFDGEIHAGASLGFDKLDDFFRIREGETSIVAGYSGHGKSMFLSQVILKMLKCGHKALVASFEMTPKAQLARWARQGLGSDNPTDEFIESFINGLDNRLYIYDQTGTVNPDRVMKVIYYSAEVLHCDAIVIDSLMKCSVNEDDMNAQKEFIDRVCVAARDLGIHIFVVAHSRKGQDETTEPPTKWSVMGSSNITNLADNVVTVYRNKKKEEQLSMPLTDSELEKVKSAPDAMFYVTKQRHGTGWEGKLSLYFDNKSLRYRDQR